MDAFLMLHRILQDAALFDHHLQRRSPQSISHRQQNVPHLRPELLQIDSAAVIGVEFLENGVVEGVELVGGLLVGHAEVGFDEAHALKSGAKLGAGEDTVMVDINVEEARIHRGIESLLIVDEFTDCGAIEDDDCHGREKMASEASMALFRV